MEACGLCCGTLAFSGCDAHASLVGPGLLTVVRGLLVPSLSSRVQRLSTQHVGSLTVIQAALQHVGSQFLDQG